MSGTLYGGKQPVAGAAIQVYAVGTAGEASAAAALLPRPVFTDGNGEFSLGAISQCSPATLLYLVATGGNAGQAGVNPNLSLLAVLGPCSALPSMAKVRIDELTTVAAAEALGGYLTGPARVGAATAELPGLASAFAAAQEVVSSADGTIQPAGGNGAVPVALLNTLADITAACVTSTGGTAGDGSPCGTLFALTTRAGQPAPADTVSALAAIVASPAANVAGLYGLGRPGSPFQPSLDSAPGTLQVTLPVAPKLLLSSSPAQLGFTGEIGIAQSGTLTVTNSGTAAGTLESADLLGAGSGAFQVQNGCTGALLPGASCSLTVGVTALDTASYTAALGLSFSNSAYPLYVPLSSQGSLVNGSQTLMYDSTFAALPAGATVLGGWQSEPGGAGLISPATGQGYGTLLEMPFGATVENRSNRMVVHLLSAGAVLGVGFRPVPGEAISFGSLMVMDSAAGTLSLLNTWDGASQPGVSSTVSVGFPLVPGKPYVVTVDTGMRKLTFTVTDPATGLSASISAGDPATESGFIPVYGYQQDAISLVAVAGQYRVDRLTVLANGLHPHVLFMGDSITYGYGGLDSQGWARMAANAAQGGGSNRLSGRPGGTTVGLLARLGEVAQLHPDVVVVYLGTNDQHLMSLAQFEANMQQVVTLVHQAGAKLVLATIAPNGATAPGVTIDWNLFLLGLPSDGFIRFDAALSLNHDCSSLNTAVLIDGVHPNVQGNLLMLQQVQKDVPWLF